MSDVLKVEKREQRGTLNNRRLRKSGRVPAVIYGHGLENIAVSLCADELLTLVQQGTRVVKLEGDSTDSAFIKECQWNTWGTAILHIDLFRVSEHEVVETTVAVELRGEAPGAKEGGVIKHLLHTLEIECKAMSIPEKIIVSINKLGMDESITIADLDIPAGVITKLASSTPVVQCSMPLEELEEGEAGDDEPEIIGRKKEDEGDE